MPHSCAVKTCRSKAKPGAALSFHRIPVKEPERLKIWLRALDIDVNTPVDELKKYIVCSEHFVPGDYTVSGQRKTDTMHRFLTPTAVPTVGLSSCTLLPGVTEDSENDRIKDVSLDSSSSEDTQTVHEEVHPSLQQCDIKVEQIPLLVEEKIQEYPQTKEEQVDQSISPDMEADTSYDAEVKSEPTTNYEPVSTSAAVTVSVNENIKEEWNEDDASSSPLQSDGVDVFVELEQPPREEKLCRFCDKRFKRDSHLIRHVDKSHKGQKAFKCLECNKEFEQRYQLVLHIRIHTGEKPFSCDFCGKTFVQNSSRLAHMRVHTGEKPYFCAKCGKSFATSNHFKFCKVQNECRIIPDENHKEEKAFKCFECNKEFNQRHQLVLHARVHTGEKPFSCDFCGRTFTQNSNRIVHLRQHTGEKPYFCKKCHKRFASSHHLKLCTGTKNKSTKKSFRCTTCGRTFHTESDLKVHTEVHESWKRHISKKLEEQTLEEEQLEAV